MRRDYLDEVEAQLMARVERGGGGRPPRRRRELLAIVPALLAAAAIVAVVVTVAGGTSPRHRGLAPAKTTALGATTPTTTAGTTSTPGATTTTSGGTTTTPGGTTTTPGATTTTSTTPGATTTTSTGTATAPGAATGPSGAVPPGFGPESFTAISELNWWLLGTAPCSSPPCTSIVRTDDGGRSFVGIPAPRTTHVSQLRFADAQNGFAYGPELWVTHDAGASWHQLDPGGAVGELEPGGGYVYAIAQEQNGTGHLLRAPIGSDTWTQLPTAGDPSFGLAVHGSTVVLETSSSTPQQLLLSNDDGVHFTSDAVPPTVACTFAPMPPVIWAECATGTMSGVWRSADTGATFKYAGSATPNASNGLPEQPNSAAFAAATPTSAVYGYNQLYRTTDGGTSWSQVSTPADITSWQYLGFTDATHGVAIGYAGTQTTANERLYYTTDGGAGYHLVSIGGG